MLCLGQVSKAGIMFLTGSNRHNTLCAELAVLLNTAYFSQQSLNNQQPFVQKQFLVSQLSYYTITSICNNTLLSVL